MNELKMWIDDMPEEEETTVEDLRLISNGTIDAVREATKDMHMLWAEIVRTAMNQRML